ncbi:MAG: hypothetical protein ACOC29_02110 [Candidatus Sumerlaeota bacterium]
MSAFPRPAQDLLPQRPPMLLVEELTACREKGSEARTRTGDNVSLFINPQGRVEPETLIEMLAQTSALDTGWRAENKAESPKKGLLAGMDHLAFTDASGQLDTGRTLSIDGEKTFELGDVTMFAGHVKHNETKLLEGNLKVWENYTLPEMESGEDTELSGEAFTLDKQASKAYSELLHCTYPLMIEKGQKLQAEGWLPESFCAFQGHFPAFPVLPAVVMVLWARVLAERRTGTSLRISKLKRAKFGNLAGPEMRLALELECTKIADSEIAGVLVISRGNARVARIDLKWKSEKGNA